MMQLELAADRWSAVRHPSYGGLTQFRQEMTDVLTEWPQHSRAD